MLSNDTTQTDVTRREAKRRAIAREVFEATRRRTSRRFSSVCSSVRQSETRRGELQCILRRTTNLARVDSSSPLCWSQAQEKREGWKPHFCKTTHTQNPQRNTTHRHQPRNSDLFKFFRGRTPGLIAWAVAMNKPG
nr:unnamed protein product [Callosobruchus chinensis]